MINTLKQPNVYRTKKMKMWLILIFFVALTCIYCAKLHQELQEIYVFFYNNNNTNNTTINNNNNNNNNNKKCTLVRKHVMLKRVE